MLHPKRLVCITACLLALSAPASALEIVEIGANGAAGEDGESVRASGSEVRAGDAPAEVLALAAGGQGGFSPAGGGPAGDGGGAGLGPLYAASDSGDVSVRGTARGGNGGFGSAGNPAGSGAPVRLHNSVDGDTAGKLVLFQLAAGGDAGLVSGGEAGRAASHIQRRKSAESLELTSRAIGGGPPELSRGRAFPVAGAPARASAHGANDAGSVRVLAGARGGPGGASLSDSAKDGGKASAVAFARSEGDGHPVFVGILPPLAGAFPAGETGDLPLRLRDALDQDYDGVVGCGWASDCAGFEERETVSVVPAGLDPNPWSPFFDPFPFAGAVGGPGGSFLSTFRPPSTPPAGDGGQARSVSIGIAAGDSPVEVLDSAAGGGGGIQVGTQDGSPSEGGAANSMAMAVGAGRSAVTATAQATGGASGPVVKGSIIIDPHAPGFSPPQDGLPGARGDATALAIGRGQALAEAVATGGLGTGVVAAAAGPRHPGGVGRALAKAVGTHGSATARAKSNSGKLNVQVSAQSRVLEAATVEARIGPSRAGSQWQRVFQRLARQRGARDSSADASVAPDAREVERALRRQPELSRELEAAGVDSVEALGSFSARQRRDLSWSSPRGTELPGDASLGAPRGTQLPGGAVFELELSDVLRTFLGTTDPIFIGLFAPQLERRGFVGLNVRLENGDDLLLDETFYSADAAESFLNGSLLAAGVIRGVGNRLGVSPDRVTLRIAIFSSVAGGGLAFDFLVGTAPPDDSQQPSPPIDWSPEP